MIYANNSIQLFFKAKKITMIKIITNIKKKKYKFFILFFLKIKIQIKIKIKLEDH